MPLIVIPTTTPTLGQTRQAGCSHRFAPAAKAWILQAPYAIASRVPFYSFLFEYTPQQDAIYVKAGVPRGADQAAIPVRRSGPSATLAWWS